MPAKAKTTRTRDEVKSKKMAYMEKFIQCMEEYPRLLLVTCDNIGSTHMQQIRIALRGKGILLMGKNTLMRKAIRSNLEDHPNWEGLINAIRGNVGLLFSKGSFASVRDVISQMTVPAVAKAGSIAPIDVVLPKQVTTLEPTKTSFFAALDIATKITKGCVEILNDVKLCEKNKKVGNSESALLQMLNIKPFTYGLLIANCFDKALFPVSFLDLDESQCMDSLNKGISNIASLSLAISYPTLPAFPHIIANGFRNLVALSLETGYSFKQAEEIKKRVENPGSFVVADVPKTLQPKVVEEKKKEPVVEEKVVEKSLSSEEEVDGLMDFY